MAPDAEPLADDLLRAVDRLADTFQARGVRYTLIGGLAVMLRGRPRFTQDVDVLLDVPQLALPGLVDDLAGQGFDLDPAAVIREYVRQHVTAFRYGGVRVDWLKPVLPLYTRALNDATPLDWSPGRPLRVATAEGLVLTKMVAFRPQDQADITTLLMANRDTFDPGVVRAEWAPLAASAPDRTAWLEATLAQYLPT